MESAATAHSYDEWNQLPQPIVMSRLLQHIVMSATAHSYESAATIKQTMDLYVLSSVLWCQLYDVRKWTMFGSTFPLGVWGMAHVLFTLFVCLSIVVSDTYCDVFLFCLSSSCVLYVGSFSSLSISYCLFGIFYRLLINTNTRGLNHPVDLKILSQLYCIKLLLFEITQSEVLKKIVLTS